MEPIMVTPDDVGVVVGAQQVPAEIVARISNYNTEAAMTPTDVTLPVLRTITNNFSQERKLGQGTFGHVYLGEYENGQKVAVKLLYNREPECVSMQFQNEFDNLMKLGHTNIVRLMGYCYETKHVAISYNGKYVLAEEATRALILEYLQNGSLQRFLSTNEELDWHTRYKIIKGICEGLKYMHEERKPPVLHLDLKPDNILLDKNMVPKLADFGLSRIYDQGTQITSCLIGTCGYQPPEYIDRKVVSKKFDIFSLGVIMIKIIEERHSDCYTSDDKLSDNFVDTVQMKWRSKLNGTCNGSLLDTYCRQVKICTEIALQCMEYSKRKRPNIVDIIDKLTAMEHEMGMFENNHARHIEREPRMIMPTSKGQRAAQLVAAQNFLLPAETEARSLCYSYSTTKGSTGLTVTELKGITDDFSENRKLGAGSFGEVYLGEDKNGEKFAVKKLAFDGLGPDAEVFKDEFDILMKVEHPNIVRLINYCYETQYEAVPYNGRLVMTEKTTRALCHEYLHNGSLEKHLSNEDQLLDWHTRYKIIKGTCEGLKYIHKERQALHLNLKPSNILLDEHMVPKLADLGISEIFQGYIGISKYQPPEYKERRLISDKFDIFSLGVIILSIVAGERAYSRNDHINHEQFADDVQRNWRSRWDNGTFVGAMLDSYCRQVKLCTEIALKCVERERIRRPNIVEIIDRLELMENKPCPPPPPGTGTCIRICNPESTYDPDGPEDTNAELQVRPGPGSSELLSVHPLQLWFPSTPSGGSSPISSKLHLTNDTDDRVAFRLLSKGRPIRDLEGPTCGVVPPKSKLTLTVTLRRPVRSGGESFEIVSTRASDEDLGQVAQDPSALDFLYQHSSFINRAKEAGREVHSVRLAATQTPAVCSGPWWYRRECLRRLFVDCFRPWLAQASYGL